MNGKRCAWWWGTGCTHNNGDLHICARPPGHPSPCMCYCGQRAPTPAPDPDTPDPLW
jgi:hypothetical protein